MLSHNGKMKECGLVGFPLGHSFSKKFFTDKFSREGIDARYDNFEIAHASQLRDIVAEHPNLEGLNCTIPHKEAIMAELDKVDTEAAEIGAVNVIKIQRISSPTLSFTDSGNKPLLIGYNSDVIGFTQSISPLLKPHHKNALILGTGGAAKAIEYGLKKLGIACTHVSRKKKDNNISYDDLNAENIGHYHIIVNCTPVGMFPHTEEKPALPYEGITNKHLLYDLVYNPLETLFLKEGRLRGAATKNGMEMLELQALASWEIWNK
jgi:shikimate dehydrogenase